MTVMTPCPPDSDLMKAYNAYIATEDYQNSYKWATAAIEHVVLPEPSDPTANRWTEEHYRKFVTGSMWAAFMAGFEAAGGTAAPDLLAALKGVIAVADRKTDEFDAARAAIAKAESAVVATGHSPMMVEVGEIPK